MALFYDWLGEKKSRGIRLAVMDMWKPFRNTTRERAPQVAILFDKSNREHLIIGSEPGKTRAAADAAVKELGWDKAYHVDADHIRLETVDRFVPHSDFYTIDVADWLGKPAETTALEAFVKRHPDLVGNISVPGIGQPLAISRAEVERLARKYLLAVQEAAFWPGYRRTRSLLFLALATVVSAALVLAVDNFYAWQVRPRLGFAQEPDRAGQLADELKTDYFSQAHFPRGDSIQLASVERSADRMVVKGHYNLVSADSAVLGLYISSTNKDVPEGERQRMPILRGAGNFELIDSHLVPGLPHVSMYDGDGKPFAEVYFGTRANRAGSIDWRHLRLLPRKTIRHTYQR